MAKLKNQAGRRNSGGSNKPRYIDAVDGDPAVVEAWERVVTRLRQLLPDLAEKDLHPRGDPRVWFGRIPDEDPEFEVARAAFAAARQDAMKRYAYLRGGR